MRFKFCGHLDCPDWLLASMAACTKLSSIKVRTVSNQLARLMAQGNVLDEGEVVALGDKLGSQDALAALHEVLSLAFRNQVDEAVFVDELQQLGLPREHSTAIGKAYSENKVRAFEQLRESFIRTGGKISFSKRDIQGVNIFICSIVEDKKCYDLAMTKGQARALLEELKEVNKLMLSHSA